MVVPRPTDGKFVRSMIRQNRCQINPVLISCIRMSWGVQVPFLSENIIRCVPLLGLPTSTHFSLGRSFHSSLSWGPTVSIAFWNKFCPVDFNRDCAACLIFLSCMTSPTIFNPVLNLAA